MLQQIQNLTTCLDNIFDYISEIDIFNKYFLKVDFKAKYINPLRPDDTTPGAYYHQKDGKIKFIDWGASPTHYTAIDVVMLMYNLSFIEAIQLIKQDFGLDFKNYSFTPEIRQIKYVGNTIIEKEPVFKAIISPTLRDFNKRDMDYWNQYYISLKTLKKYCVSVVDRCYINEQLYHIYTNADPMYCYQEKDLYKIYRPYGGRSRKWRTNFSGGILEGYSQLPEKGELLIITKSRKDVMVLSEMHYNAVAVKSETSIPSTNAMQLLKSRFKNIICLFDNDSTGINALNKINSVYNLKTTKIDSNYGVKDISDFIKKYGPKNTYHYTKQIFFNES